MLVTYVEATAQKNTISEPSFFMHPKQTIEGVVATDNLGSQLYFLKNNSLEILHSSPACGRYFTISSDKKFIGFKLITNEYKQIPALYDIEKREVIELHEAVELCGQTTFGKNGEIVFTIGGNLHIRKANEINKYRLDEYVNLYQLSPDGKYLVYSDGKNRLKIFNTQTHSTNEITAEKLPSFYPQWSPDGKKIVYSVAFNQLHVLEIQTENQLISGIKIHHLGIGSNPVWNKDAENILYEKVNMNGQNRAGTEIVISDYTGKNKTQLTHTKDVDEMNATFTNENKIMYHTFTGCNIVVAHINKNKRSIEEKKILYYGKNKVSAKYYQNKTKNRGINEDEIVQIENVPYVNQVYDTPDFHNGYASCAPSTAVMAFAYYNTLPPWPTTITSFGEPYANDYGSYVADKYRFRETYYNLFHSGRMAWGGFGYMWTGGSPYSRMQGYIKKHGLESSQVEYENCTFDYIISEIDEGFVHPVCSWLTTSGHLTLTVGYIKDKHILISNDPYGNKNIAYPSRDGRYVKYDWAGYNNGYANIDPYNHGGVAWTVTARAEQMVYNDTIIDDTYYKNGFYMFNEKPSKMDRFRDKIAGYNNHYWWTYTRSNTALSYVKWTPTLSETKKYDVYAYIPTLVEKTAGAVYEITHAKGDTAITINQNHYNDEWAFIGTYTFDDSGNSHVKLTDLAETANKMIAFDALKWQTAPTEGFNAINCNITAGDSVWFYNYFDDALSYEWTLEGGEPQTSTDKNPIVKYFAEGTYNVTLTAHYENDSKTVEIENFLSVEAKEISTIYNAQNTAGCAVYPNPFNNELTVEIETDNATKTHFTVFDIQGRKISAFEHTNQRGSTSKFNISKQKLNVEQGLYILLIKTGQNIFTRKISVY